MPARGPALLAAAVLLLRLRSCPGRPHNATSSSLPPALARCASRPDAHHLGFCVSRGGGSGKSYHREPPAPDVLVHAIPRHRVAFVEVPKSASTRTQGIMKRWGAQTMEVTRFVSMLGGRSGRSGWFVFTFLREPLSHWVSGVKQASGLGMWGTPQCHGYASRPACAPGSAARQKLNTQQRQRAHSASVAQAAAAFERYMAALGWGKRPSDASWERRPAMSRPGTFLNRHTDPQARRLLIFVGEGGGCEGPDAWLLEMDMVGRLEHYAEDFRELARKLEARGQLPQGSVQLPEQKELSTSTKGKPRAHVGDYCSGPHEVICGAMKRFNATMARRVCEFIQLDLTCLGDYYPEVPACRGLL